jgi:hypothetical protein
LKCPDTIGRLVACGNEAAAADRNEDDFAPVAFFGGIARLIRLAPFGFVGTLAFGFAGTGATLPAEPAANPETPTRVMLRADLLNLTTFPAGTGVAVDFVAFADESVAAPTDAAATAASSSPARNMAAGANLRRFKIPLLSIFKLLLSSSSISTLQIACLRGHHPPFDALQFPNSCCHSGRSVSCWSSLRSMRCLRTSR